MVDRDNGTMAITIMMGMMGTITLMMTGTMMMGAITMMMGMSRTITLMMVQSQ